MRLFRRRETLNEQLLREAGITHEAQREPTPVRLPTGSALPPEHQVESQGERPSAFSPGHSSRDDEIDEAVWDAVDRARAEVAREQREQGWNQWDSLGESLMGLPPSLGPTPLGAEIWRRFRRFWWNGVLRRPEH
jgi:hypothetical protein